MGRNRASVEGGYVRKTLSLPADLVTQIDQHIEGTGVTISLFMTEAGRDHLAKKRKR